MSNANETTSPITVKEKYEHVLFKVVHMRKTYPRACASYFSRALHRDVDIMMKAEVVPKEKLKEVYSPQYIDRSKLEKLNLNTKLEPFTNKGEELYKQIIDIQDALKQIQAARHKNVQE